MALGNRKSRASGEFPEMGAIFMSNRATKRECFRRKLLGLPSTFGSFVKHVKAGMLLFLFDYETRSLYGVYQACSDGKMNIVPDAYNSSGRKYPAQVLFRTLWYCSPISEKEFSSAISDNYFAPFKFNFGLSRKQVQNLLRLFSSRIKRDEIISRNILFREAKSVSMHNASRSNNDDAVSCDVENEYVPQYVHGPLLSEGYGVSVFAKDAVLHRFLSDELKCPRDTLTCDIEEEYVPQYVHDNSLFSEDSGASILSEKRVQPQYPGKGIKDTGDEVIKDEILSLMNQVGSFSDCYWRDGENKKNIPVEKYERTRFGCIVDEEDKRRCSSQIESLHNNWSLSSGRTNEEELLRGGNVHLKSDFSHVLSGCPSPFANSNFKTLEMSSDNPSDDHTMSSCGTLSSVRNQHVTTKSTTSTPVAVHVLSGDCNVHSEHSEGRFTHKEILVSEDDVLHLRSMPKDTSTYLKPVSQLEKFHGYHFAERLLTETQSMEPNSHRAADSHSLSGLNIEFYSPNCSGAESSEQNCISREMVNVYRSGTVLSRLKPAAGTARAEESRTENNSAAIVDEVMLMLDEHYRQLIREKSFDSTVKDDGAENISHLHTKKQTQCMELVTINFDKVSESSPCVDFKRRSEMRKVHKKANIQGSGESLNVVSSEKQRKRRKLIRPWLSHKDLWQAGSSLPESWTDAIHSEVPLKDEASSSIMPLTWDKDRARSPPVTTIVEGDSGGSDVIHSEIPVKDEASSTVIPLSQVKDSGRSHTVA